MFSKPYAVMYYVHDMKKAAAFYTQTLGGHARFESEGWTEIDFGGTVIALHHSDKAPKHTETTPHLILEVADIEKTVGELKEKRIEFHQQISPIEGCGFCATMLDPCGNAVGLYQRT